MNTILIVDDDPEMLDSTESILTTKGYNVITALNGEDGFLKAKKEKPNLMLLDVMMTHDTEGFEIARKLRSDDATRSMPVIIMTGIRKAKTLPFRYEPDEDWLPVKAVLEKPVQPETLLAEVEKALRKTSDN